MIGFLSGTISYIADDYVIILVGGVGYKVNLGEKKNEISVGDALDLYIYTHVREDELSLIGFFSPLDLQIFEMLISISGIGPKGAINIVSRKGSKKIINAILTNNSLELKVPGIGAKTVEKVILELKDRLIKKGFKIEGSDGKIKGDLSVLEKKEVLDAKEALINLGFRRYEVETAILDSKPKTNDSTEAIIKKALIYLKK